MTITVLTAGDAFVTNELLTEALRAELGDTPVRFSELSLPWPDVPFGSVGEVQEASGTEDQLIQALDGVDVCVTQMAPLTERVLAAAPSLKLFGISRGGPVNANLAAATRHGVAVTSAPGRNATATAEHTIGMMLAAMRRIPQTNADLSAGIWRSDYYRYDAVGPELGRSIVGLIGFGAIGSRVTAMLRGFDAEVLVYDPYVHQHDLGEQATKVEFEELLARSNVVSLHARLTRESIGMIGAEQLRALPRGAVLVNCARGALLDYDALCDALEDGHLFGAAVDVFPEEPVPAGSRLLSTPNIVMTPHLAGASKQTAHKAAELVAADVARYLRGEPLAFCANPEALATRR